MFRVAVLVLAMSLASCASAANDAEALQHADDEFTPLFNGRDLSGWTHITKAGEGYQVREGVLYCRASDGGNLFTEKEYDNFVLRFEFKLTPGANNGVGIRAPRTGRIAYDAVEIQILDDTADKYAKLRPTQYHGSIYDCVPAERGHLKPVGEWNEEEITVDGRRITVKLNGVTIVDANLDEITDPKTLAKHPGLQRTRGHIGFLGHGSAIELRNLRIKEL